MKTTRHFTWAPLALAAGALAAGCGGSSYNTPVYRPAPVQPAASVTVVTPAPAVASPSVSVVETRPVEPVVIPSSRHDAREIEDFRAEMRRDMDRYEAQVRDDLARGRVLPQALDDLHARRQYVEQLISQYTSDGELREHEQHHVESVVRDMGRAVEDYPHQARGGGPVYVR